LAQRPARSVDGPHLEGAVEVGWQLGHGRRGHWSGCALPAFRTEGSGTGACAEGWSEMSTTAATVHHTQHAGELERYTFTERIMHWLTGGTYLYCLATGLAFYSPHLYWLAYMLGGAPTSRFWHPIFAIGFVIGTLWMHSMWGR